jgi:hypothetical protein
MHLFTLIARGWLLGWALWGCSFLYSQTWTYTDLLTDRREGGSYPELVAGPDGTLHLTYWNAETDRLMYAQRPAGGGPWLFEAVEPAQNGGYRSALVLDGTVPCVAYFANVNGKIQVRYARRTAPGVWAVQTPTATQYFGNYGPIWLFSDNRPQPSLDLRLLPNNQPAICVFDASFNSCSDVNSIGFRMWYLKREPTQQWLAQQFGFLNVDVGNGLDWEDCSGQQFISNTVGARYGEYCQFVEQSDGRTRIVFTEKSNGQLTLFTEPTAGWDFGAPLIATPDSQRIESNRNLWPYGEFTPNIKWVAKSSIEGLSVLSRGDSVVFYTYTLSDNYGRNDQNDMSSDSGFVRRIFTHGLYFGRWRMFPPGPVDTSQLLTPLYYLQETPAFNTGYEYRHSTELLAIGPDTLLLTVGNSTRGRYELYRSTNAGLNWNLLPATEYFPDSFQLSRMPARLALVNDTVHTLLFNAQRKELIHGVRPANFSTPWAWNTLRLHEERGAAIALHVQRNAPQPDVLHIAWSDRIRQELWYGTGPAGDSAAWVYERVLGTPIDAAEVRLVLDSAQRPVILYTDPTARLVRAATRNAGVWSAVTVSSLNTQARNLRLVYQPQPEVLHVAWQQVNNRSIQYARRVGGVWNVLAGPGPGTDPDDLLGAGLGLALDATNTPHVAYTHEHLRAATAPDPPFADSLSIRLGRWLGGNNWQTTVVQNDSDATILSRMYSDVNLGFGPDGQPRLTFQRITPSEPVDTFLVGYRRTASNTWEYLAVPSFFNGLETAPLLMQLDSTGRPWLAHNLIGNPDELQLVRIQHDWQAAVPIVVQNNPLGGRIGQVFDYRLAGLQQYVVGRKNVPGNYGLALLHLDTWAPYITTLAPELSQLRLSVYPNPGHDWLAIAAETPAGNQPAELTLLNLQGQVVAQWRFQLASTPERLAVPQELPNGLYVYRLATPQGTVTGKWMRHP